MQPPETRYANVGDSQVAYQVFGEGPDLVWVQGFTSHVDYRWEEPRQARFLTRLASFARVIMFDRRGVGASDQLPPGAATSWEDWVEDLNAVLKAAGSERPTLMASIDGGPMVLLFAATYPERVASLVLVNTNAKPVAEPGYPGIPAELAEMVVRVFEEGWGKEDGMIVRTVAPDQAGDPDFVRWFARLQRASMTPRRAVEMLRLVLTQDVRHVLPLIQAPTLVVAVRDFPLLLPLESSQYLVDHIEGAKLLLLEGASSQTFLLEPDRLLEAIEELVTGQHRSVEPDRVLATVLFTDIVGSTERASEMGDRRWREVLDRHDEVSRREVVRHGGRLVKTTGDGILATFDGPARAIRSAAAIRDDLASGGVQLRLGLHAGEVEVRGDDVGGIAVHIAARVMALARAGEVLVSGTVKGLVAGSGLAFEDRGVHELKGIPDQWALHALAG
ncbi:MAG: adenylate/guanylate cyclase domain-containing protein [Actinomycetota bacterium]